MADLTSDTLFRKELLMDKDSFQKPLTRDNLEGLAQTIQNLLIISPGTMPNDPLMGCGISNYLFEFNDNTTITNLQNLIEEQIATYVLHPDVSVVATVSSESAINNKLSILVVSIEIYDSNSKPSSLTDNSSSLSMTYQLAGNNETKQVISNLVTT